MKIFKAVTLTEVSEVGANIGETIVCPTKENPNDYQVYVHRVKGIYTPCGKFTDLKTAIKYAERLENPSMIKQGYQIIELSHSQKLIIYYDQMNEEVLDYIHCSEQISDVSIQLEESGLSIRFIIPKETEIQQMNRLNHRDEMVGFGNYLLSSERRERFASHPVLGDRNLEQRLSEVCHSDFDNYQAWLKLKDSDTPLESEPIEIEPHLDIQTLTYFEKMCQESCSPEVYHLFKDKVVGELKMNRKGLRRD